MSTRTVRLGHCHRCIYTWRMRRRTPLVCPRCKSRLWKVPKIRPVRLGDGQGVDEIIGSHRIGLLRLAKRYGARNVRIFGSVRRREATANSDLDLLVEWDRRSDLLDVVRFRREIEALLERTVDLVEPSRLHWAVRPIVLAEAVPL